MIPIGAFVALGFGLALIASVLPKRFWARAPWISWLFGSVVCASSLLLWFDRPDAWKLVWVSEFGAELAFKANPPQAAFGALILGIGGLIIIYAGGYLAGQEQLGRLQSLLLAFMASMMGFALADNWATIFLFWELTSFFSYLLIGFDPTNEQARKSARQAFVITGAGGLFLLVGLQPGVPSSLAAFCILIACMTKSAIFPFHFWLPGAMTAPTPISAYLHSATMVKAGVFLLFLKSDWPFDWGFWLGTLLAIGAIVTGVIAFRMAVTEHDLKKLLAASTLGALSLLSVLAVIPEIGTTAFLGILIAHALYKGALFMIAGRIDHATGTRDIRALGGLRKAMQGTFAIALVAGLAMFGLPPTFSFWAKEVALASTPWLWFGIVGLSASFVIVALKVAWFPFVGPEQPVKHPGHAFPLLFGPAVMAGLGLLGPLLLQTSLLQEVLGPVSKEGYWHGFNELFALSLLGIAIGISVTAYQRRHPKRFQRFPWSVNQSFELFLKDIQDWGKSLAKSLTGDLLRNEFALFFAVTTALVALAVFPRRALNFDLALTPPRIEEILIIGLAAIAAGLAAFQKSRIATVALLGITGSAIALIYLAFGAPDLAITQFLIEMLIVVLFIVGFSQLPKFRKLSTANDRVRDATVALCFGGMMTLLVIGVLSGPRGTSVSRYFNEQAMPNAKGQNVVNTIIVDFRALDTLGEITVLALAAVGVTALLRGARKGKGSA